MQPRMCDIEVSSDYVSNEDLILLPTDGAGILRDLSSSHSEQYLKLPNVL